MEELLKKFHLESALGQLKFPCKVGETLTTLQPHQFTELRPSLNQGSVIAGVVAGMIVNEETVP